MNTSILQGPHPHPYQKIKKTWVVKSLMVINKYTAARVQYYELLPIAISNCSIDLSLYPY